jgi:putative PIN family toxin of toxin-antitoxin system
MLPLRLVLDTNIVVSAALKPDGLQRAVLLLAMTRPARLYVTLPIAAEYREVLARPEFKIRKGLRRQLLQVIQNRAYRVSPSQTPDVTPDPDDNIFIACADAARADYLVTGNVRHFPRFWKQTKIITARELLTLAAPHLIRTPPTGNGGERS